MGSALDVLGSLLQGGMSNSTPSRIENSLSERGIGARGGFLDQVLGGAASQGAPQAAGTSAGSGLGGALSSMLGGSSNLKAGGLGALAGAVLGGGAKGAIGGGALALLGSMALHALRGAGATQPDASKLDPAARLAAGLRPPANQQEEKEVESTANLIVKAMINAAKADGTIDEREMQRIAANVGKGGSAEQGRDELIKELRKPLDTDSIVRSVSSPQVAAQIYAASLLAIDVDSDAERQYMEDLAGKLHLDNNVVRQLHAVVGAN